MSTLEPSAPAGVLRTAPHASVLCSWMAAVGALAVVVFMGSRPEPAAPADVRFVPAESARQRISAIVDSKRCDLLTRPDCSDLEGPLRAFYEGRHWRLAWIDRDGATRQADEVVSFLSSAGQRGLDPADYDADGWDQRRATATGISLDGRVRFDVALTAAVMRMVADLYAGRIDPREAAFVVDAAKMPDLAPFVGALCTSEHPEATLESIEPPYAGYKRLLAALSQYRALAKEVGEVTLEETRLLEPGSDYADAPKLAALLRVLGDLPQKAVVDSSPRYEGALVEGVKHFQERHGFAPDGRVGPATFRAINTPLVTRVRQIELTLERWRWAPRDIDRPPVVVNIPEYQLNGFDNEGRPALGMRVVVGKAALTPTPVLRSRVERVIFQPYWNVPDSILKGEILPGLDDAYLTDHDMEIIDRSGRNVTLGDDAVAGLRAGRLRLRQRPGPKNALGPVKFEFPNAESIYLHGTPSQSLFDRSRRDFSHGCIRVEDPETLAAWLLRDESGWTRARIREALAGGTTQSVKLSKPAPVFLIYGTAVVMEDGEVRFFEDVYGIDKALDVALAKPRWTATGRSSPVRRAGGTS